jgi:hypothetical protein
VDNRMVDGRGVGSKSSRLLTIDGRYDDGDHVPPGPWPEAFCSRKLEDQMRGVEFLRSHELELVC